MALFLFFFFCKQVAAYPSCLWPSPFFLYLLFLLWSKVWTEGPVDAEHVVHSTILEVFHRKQLWLPNTALWVQWDKWTKAVNGTISRKTQMPCRRKGSLAVTPHGFDDMYDCILMWILLNSLCIDSNRWWLVTGIYEVKVRMLLFCCWHFLFFWFGKWILIKMSLSGNSEERKKVPFKRCIYCTYFCVGVTFCRGTFTRRCMCLWVNNDITCMQGFSHISIWPGTKAYTLQRCRVLIKRAGCR